MRTLRSTSSKMGPRRSRYRSTRWSSEACVATSKSIALWPSTAVISLDSSLTGKKFTPSTSWAPSPSAIFLSSPQNVSRSLPSLPPPRINRGDVDGAGDKVDVVNVEGRPWLRTRACPVRHPLTRPRRGERLTRPNPNSVLFWHGLSVRHLVNRPTSPRDNRSL